jgi:Fe-S cluster biogenesis protein NfuA
MKMGLERGLREKIPEIVDVVQDLGEGGPELSPETVETVLDTVRPFLNVAGGTIELADLRGVGGMQVWLSVSCPCLPCTVVPPSCFLLSSPIHTQTLPPSLPPSRQPAIVLKMGGKSAALRSVKTEIMQRLQRNFMIPGLRIDWE